MPKFIKTPFANNGDKGDIPDDIQTSGSVSWTQGFGPDYELDPASDDPDIKARAKRVPRLQSNQLYFDLSENLQQWQLYTFPNWYDPQDTGVAYSTGARVRYTTANATRIYISIKDNNSDAPTNTSSWIVDDPRFYALQNGSRNYGVTTGSSSSYQVTINPEPGDTFRDGFPMVIRAHIQNNANATITVNNGTPNPIYKHDGTRGIVRLTGGEMRSPGDYTLIWNQAIPGWFLQNTQPTVGLPNRITWSYPRLERFTIPAGVVAVYVRVKGGGGAGGGTSAGRPGGYGLPSSVALPAYGWEIIAPGGGGGSTSTTGGGIGGNTGALPSIVWPGSTVVFNTSGENGSNGQATGIGVGTAIGGNGGRGCPNGIGGRGDIGYTTIVANNQSSDGGLGGGGGGAGGTTGSDLNAYAGGGGGASGGYTEVRLPVNPGDTLEINIGAAGAPQQSGGPAGFPKSGGNGYVTLEW